MSVNYCQVFLDLRLGLCDQGQVPLFLWQEALRKHDSSGMAGKLQVTQLHVHVDERTAARIGRPQRRWVRRFKIVEDRRRLEKYESIFLKGRHATIRVDAR